MGGSDWKNGDSTQIEDVAGIGLFCLAPGALTVRSLGQRVTIGADEWLGKTAAKVESDDYARRFEQKLLRLCSEMSALDDRLGKFSDYEGNEFGPTCFLFKNHDKTTFDYHANSAIALHKEAIRLWRELKKMITNNNA
jgi:hypothetical protein